MLGVCISQGVKPKPKRPPQLRGKSSALTEVTVLRARSPDRPGLARRPLSTSREPQLPLPPTFSRFVPDAVKWGAESSWIGKKESHILLAITSIPFDFIFD